MCLLCEDEKAYQAYMAYLDAMERQGKMADPDKAMDAALDALEADHDYLTAGGVFPEELIKNFIKTKREECRRMAAIPHPAEFEQYYNL